MSEPRTLQPTWVMIVVLDCDWYGEGLWGGHFSSVQGGISQFVMSCIIIIVDDPHPALSAGVSRVAKGYHQE